MIAVELTARWLAVAQAGVYVLLSPLFAGVVLWLKSRLQGRRGPGPLQLYRDLWNLLRIRPTRPASTSVVFLIAPSVLFTCFVLLGLALPTVVVPAGAGMDLVLVVGLLTLARFVMTLAAFDAGAPFGPMSAGRQWFIHVLAEPAMLVTAYIFALSAGTTSVPHLVPSAPGKSLLATEPTISIAVGALLFVLLAETGRLPFDRPGTHLELTMIEEGVTLEYSGRALALTWWAYSMKLTFAVSLIAFLALPPPAEVDTTARQLGAQFLMYLAKVGVLLLLLAIWENSSSRMRLRAILTPLMLATGVLLFTLASLIVAYIARIPTGE